MAQWLGVLTVITKEPEVAPSIQKGNPRLPVTLVLEDPKPSSLVHRPMRVHGTYIYATYTHTNALIVLINNNKLNRP